MAKLMSMLAGVGPALALAAAGAFAAEPDEGASLPEKPQASVEKLVRHETLELPGLTACHQCEWRPHLHEQAAADQCGFSADGAPKIGQFECGFSPDCDRVCNFLSCLP
jgi:hypothetical protein